MGAAWAWLYVLGLAMPGVVFIASTAVVYRLARRLRGMQEQARPIWQYVLLHVGLGIGLALPLGPLAMASWLLVPAYLYRTVLRLEGATAAGRLREAGLLVKTGRRHRGLAVLFVVTGVVVPWATGLGVKVYLDAQGRPTLPLGGFLDPASVIVEILLTLGAWALPFLLLASAVLVPWRVGFAADSPDRDSLLPIWLAYAAGVIAAVPVFVSVFWEFDSMMMLVPVGLVLLPPMALGYLMGWWLLRRRTSSFPDGARGEAPDTRGSGALRPLG